LWQCDEIRWRIDTPTRRQRGVDRQGTRRQTLADGPGQSPIRLLRRAMPGTSSLMLPRCKQPSSKVYEIVRNRGRFYESDAACLGVIAAGVRPDAIARRCSRQQRDVNQQQSRVSSRLQSGRCRNREAGIWSAAKTMSTRWKRALRTARSARPSRRGSCPQEKQGEPATLATEKHNGCG